MSSLTGTPLGTPVYGTTFSGDKEGEEKNWPPYLTCRWLRISVLSNRHSTYASIQNYLVFTSTIPSRCPDWMLAHCSPSSKWVPGGNCGETKERNWPPYLTCLWLRISVLSNRHSTYASIQNYLVFTSTIPSRCPDWMLAHCSPSSKWVPGGNCGETKERNWLP